MSLDRYAHLGNGTKNDWGHPDIRVTETQVLEFVHRFLPGQTRKLQEAIGAVVEPEEEPVMLLIGSSSHVWGITHPTPVSIQDAYFDYVRDSEWAGLLWWIFEDYKD